MRAPILLCVAAGLLHHAQGFNSAVLKAPNPTRPIASAPATPILSDPPKPAKVHTSRAVRKMGVRFRLPSFPSHLALPALSYTSLAAVTAGTLYVLQPLAWQGVALVGYCVGFPVAVVMAQLAAAGGSGVAKAMGGMPSEDPRLQKIARDAADVVGVKGDVKVFEIKSREPNAFAATSLTARDPTVAVTTGLREVLTENELAAVLAHEMGHLRHKDVLRNMHVATAAAGLGGVYEVGRALLDSSRRTSSRKKKKDDEGDGAGLGLALMAGGLATQATAHGLRLMASRNAELKADRAAAEAYGADTMISALRKIDAAAARRPADLRSHKDGKAFAFAMISDGPSPAGAAAEKPGWFSAASTRAAGGGGAFAAVGRFFGRLGTMLRTHPTLDTRVAALEQAAAAGIVPQHRPRASFWG